MTRPVGYILLQFGMRVERRGRLQLIQDIAQGIDDLQVGELAVAADVITFPDPAAAQDQPDGFAMVLDIDPIADLPPVAINGQGFSVEAFTIINGTSFSGNW